MNDGSLLQHTGGQLAALCVEMGLGAAAADHVGTLGELLGNAANRPLNLAPASLSDISDDHTPVEFSITFLASGSARLRYLVEPGSAESDLAAKQNVGLNALTTVLDRAGISSRRLEMITDLFLPDRPQGAFALWVAVELGAHGLAFKAYLNPAVNGPDGAGELVAEALRRLGLAPAWDTVRRAAGHASTRFPFFAIDLGAWQRPRVKVYLAHPGVTPLDAAAWTEQVRCAEPWRAHDFCRDVGGPIAVRQRPILRCLAFTPDDSDDGTECSGVAVHVPVRHAVSHDGVARDWVRAAVESHASGAALLDRALTAVATRPLTDAAGLISWASLTQGPLGRRVTVYLSSEAYRGAGT